MAVKEINGTCRYTLHSLEGVLYLRDDREARAEVAKAQPLN